MQKYALPELPYAYDALEPYIDRQTMYLHHRMHQQGYVDGLNKAYSAMQQAMEDGDYDMIQHHIRKAAFNGGGVSNHNLFWLSMAPEQQAGRTLVDRRFLEQVNADFGSLARMKKLFSQAAINVEGSGWAMLCWDPAAQCLVIQTVENQQNNHRPGITPLLALDVWEHAYYLTYQNRRKEYVNSWWNIVNWAGLSQRFEELD